MTADDLLQQLEERRRSSISAYHIVTADEVAEWPDALLTQLLAEGALDETTPAISAECTACDEGHAELVQVVEEPPGSALRHYISCSEIGRVRIDPGCLRRWQLKPRAEPARDHEQRVDLPGDPTSAWPPTAAAFAEVLRKAGRGGLRWDEIRKRLSAAGHFPHRVRDVRRTVDNWDDVIESPHKGSYRHKSAHETPT